MKLTRKTKIKWRELIALVIILGIIFRCFNIDQKVYWHDEVFTSIRVLGYSGEDVVNSLFNGQIIQASDLLKFQQFNPAKTWQDTLAKLIEHPEHPPLYYLLLRFWVSIFGSSVAAMRSLSVVFSFLIFPAIYYFCKELFGNKNVGSIAIALVAICPFHVLYAQEAREYSIWTAAILLASYCLIKVVNIQENSSNIRHQAFYWSLYSLTLALSFYISVLSALLAIAHFIYILLKEKLQFTNTVKYFIMAGIGSVILFSPWLWIIWHNWERLQSKTNWTNIKQSFSWLALRWQLHFNSIFIDYTTYSSWQTVLTIFLILLCFVLLCFYHLLNSQKPRVWLFLLTLTIIPACSLILPDLLFGGIRSSMTRYFVPSILGVEIVVAYWLSQSQFYIKRFTSLAMVSIAAMGIISCGISFSSETWWNKVVSFYNADVAAIINNSQNPLIISDTHEVNVGNLISLSYLVKPETKFLLVKELEVPEIKPGFGRIFVFNNSGQFLKLFKEKNKADLKMLVEFGSSLWEVQHNVKDN